MATDLDLPFLRTLVAIADTGTFARAGSVVGRTAPAVGLQMRKLEEQLGVALFQRQGRNMALTPEGERLLVHARQMVQMNDHTVSALAADALGGELQLGATQDFADTVLPDILAGFARLHPGVKLNVLVGRSSDLADAVARGDLDLALAAGKLNGFATPLVTEDMVWIGADHFHLAPQSPLPLVLFEDPCPFRESAIRQLGAVGRSWRVSYSSPSLSGVRAAVQAGLGVTVRTKRFLGPGLLDVSESFDLPPLGKIKYALYRRTDDPRSESAALENEVRGCFKAQP